MSFGILYIIQFYNTKQFAQCLHHFLQVSLCYLSIPKRVYFPNWSKNMCKLSTKAAFVPNVPYSIYYSCTCSVQAFWKIKHIINTLFSKHLLLPLVRQTPRYWRRRNALDRINGICKSDSIFSFLNTLHNIVPIYRYYTPALFFWQPEYHIASNPNHYANRTSKSTCKPCAFACLCIVYHLISSFYATVLLPVCVFSERFKNCL